MYLSSALSKKQPIIVSHGFMRASRQLCEWPFNTSELPESLAEMLLRVLDSATKYKIVCFSKPASFTLWPPFGLRCLDTVLKNGYHKRMHAKLLPLCLTLYNPMDCSLPDSSVHGILQARILEWVQAISSSRGSFRPRDWTHVSCSSWIAGGFFTAEPPGKPCKRIALCYRENLEFSPDKLVNST